MLAVGAGCGGDDEEAERPAATREERTAVTETEPERTETVVEEEEEEPRTRERESEVPGGPGDEEPASSQALFTGRAGRISPRLVRVPPFIAIRVELHSADGGAYALRFGSQRVRTTERETDSLLLEGLRPGRRAVGEPLGERGNRVVIEASAEPGP